MITKISINVNRYRQHLKSKIQPKPVKKIVFNKKIQYFLEVGINYPLTNFQDFIKKNKVGDKQKCLATPINL